MFSLDSASLTLIWASWMGYLQTCSHRSCWLKMISKMHDENADLCGLKQLHLLWFTPPSDPNQNFKDSLNVANKEHRGLQTNGRTAVLPSSVLCADQNPRLVRFPVHTQSVSEELCKQLWEKDDSVCKWTQEWLQRKKGNISRIWTVTQQRHEQRLKLLSQKYIVVGMYMNAVFSHASSVASGMDIVFWQV